MPAPDATTTEAEATQEESPAEPPTATGPFDVPAEASVEVAEEVPEQIAAEVPPPVKPRSQTPRAAPKFPDPFHIIAHRGASAVAPENTVPAFERALALGAFEVELDVMLSADDVLVLFHDSTLDLKTNLTGRVRDHPAAELLKTDIGQWFDDTHPEVEERYAGTLLVTLYDLCLRFGRDLYYHIEIKAQEPAIPRLILAEVADFGLGDRVTLTSFFIEQLVSARKLAADVPIALLIVPEDELRELPMPGGKPARGTLLEMQRSWIDEAKAADFQMVGILSRDLSIEVVEYARSAGLEIRAWGIRDDDDMDRAIAVGANGMTTNWPDRLMQRVAKQKGSARAAR